MPKTKPGIRPAHTLKEGDTVRFVAQDLTIASVTTAEEWTTILFTSDYFNPHTMTWTRRLECHFGFCLKVT